MCSASQRVPDMGESHHLQVTVAKSLCVSLNNSMSECTRCFHAGVQGDNPCIKVHVCRGRGQDILQRPVYMLSTSRVCCAAPGHLSTVMLASATQRTIHRTCRYTCQHRAGAG